MSTYNDFIAHSNNSINDNMYNAKKAKSTTHQIKKLLKPLLCLLKKNKSKKISYKKEVQPEFYIDECEDNLQNEILENRIFEEIDTCGEYSAVPIYGNEHMEICPIVREQRYIPVHFARTEAGTFFWTSVSSADCDISCVGDKNAYSEYQTPELQVSNDRWAQA